MGELLSSPLVTRNQVDLMRQDNIASVDLPGLTDLDIEPRNIGEVIRSIED
jgi:NADH dehydrogenase